MHRWATRLVAILVVASLCHTTSAEAEPDLSFLQAQYIDPENGSKGLSISGSHALGEDFLVHGHFNEFQAFDGTAFQISLGAAAQYPRDAAVRFFFGLSAEVLGGAFEDDNDSGWDGFVLRPGGTVGINASIGRRFGLQASATVEGVTHGARVLVGGHYYLTDHWATAIDVTHDVFGTRVGLGFRYAPGRH